MKIEVKLIKTEDIMNTIELSQNVFFGGTPGFHVVEDLPGRQQLVVTVALRRQEVEGDLERPHATFDAQTLHNIDPLQHLLTHTKSTQIKRGGTCRLLMCTTRCQCRYQEAEVLSGLSRS